MATTPSSPGSAPDQLAGRLLAGRYRLNRPIASGGMAQVWEATDQTLARRVAVKILHPHLASDDSFVTRFRAEAVAAARLSHPSIVSVYDTCAEGGLEAIVMELVVGTTMRADLDEHGPMKLEAVLAIGTQVADALGASHAAGLVHRDVKPANILLSADGRVLVADFGIAKAAEGNDLTSAGAMVGTAKYLAPEQVEGGPIDGRADLYALGVVLYEALTGQAPFQAETDASTALARLHRDPTRPSALRADLPAAVEAVVLRAMARDRADRYGSAAELRTALLRAGADPTRASAVATAAAATHTPPPPTRTAPPPPAPRASTTPPPPPLAEPADEFVRPARSRRWPSILVLLLVAGALGFAAVRLLQPSATTGPVRTLDIVAVTSFDPEGDNGTEREDLVGNLIDGDPSTTWRSETYRVPDAMGKDGMGVVVSLEGERELSQLLVQGIDGGWSARAYVASGDDLPDRAAWGDPVTSVADVDAGEVRFDLGGARGDRVLLWFTRVSDSGIVEVAEVQVRGR